MNNIELLKIAEDHNNLGNALMKQGRLDESEASYREAIKINPIYVEAFNNLGNVAKALNRLTEAEQYYRQAIALRPDYAELYISLGNLLKDEMKFIEAEEAYRTSLKLNPNNLQGYSHLLFAITHNDSHSQNFCTTEAKNYGQVLNNNITPLLHSEIKKDIQKKLRIGFVSGDFCDHSVAFFIEPLLSYINKNQYALFAYYNNTIIDGMTQRFQKHFSTWRNIAALNDQELVQLIISDQIDIAIDLSGHTAKNRLLAFARRPAPIQVSWIGYPATTGLQTMDYYFVDSDWSPEGLLDDYFVEKLVYLPSAFTFKAPINSPDVTDCPALKNGYFTFGSFNRTSKLTDQTLDLWCKVLNEIPHSKMLLGNVSDIKLQQQLEEKFFQRGVNPDRLVFHPRKGILGYLALHSEVDLILDTYPLAGITITGFALWMGVPVLTYAWRSLAGRGGVAMLSRVDLHRQFVAETEQQFIQMAKEWSKNINGLQTLRHELRHRMQHFPKCKPENVATGLESALRMMWERLCSNLPVESFKIDLNEKITTKLNTETDMNKKNIQHASVLSTSIKLDLGCGLTPKEGFEGVDFFTPTAMHQVNLMKFPWPWKDNSVDEIFTSHFLEHLPMVFVDSKGNYSLCPETPDDRDLLFRFMDECWRIMKPNAKMTIIVPSGRSSRGFQDPTHRRFFVSETFAYFNAGWRKHHGIDHYMGGCDFDIQVQPRVKSAVAALPQKEQDLMFETQWNSIQDFQATLVALKSD